MTQAEDLSNERTDLDCWHSICQNKQHEIRALQHIFIGKQNPQINRPLSSVVKTSLPVRDVRGSIRGSVKSNTESPKALHRCDVSSDLCCPGAKLQRWAEGSLVTRFGVISSE